MKILIIITLGCATMAMAGDEQWAICNINANINRNLLQVVLAQSPNRSVAVSSFSLLTPLGQLLFSAEGNTRKELLTLFRATFQDINRTVTDLLETNKKVASISTDLTLKQGSRIYIKKELQLNETFVIINKRFFNINFLHVDFELKNQEIVNEVNSWVNEQTDSKISKVLDHLASNTIVMLINYVYFKAKWAIAFPKENSMLEDFHTSLTEKRQVPFMSKKDTLRYTVSSELDAWLVEIPYIGADRDAYFLAVVPNSVEGLNDLMPKLNSSSLKKAMKTLKKVDVILHLPKFTVSTFTDLKSALIELGLKTTFTQDADLRYMIKDSKPIHISGGAQKTYIAVDEEGTEVTAVNEMTGGPRPMVLQTPRTLLVNRPFYFEINIVNLTMFSGIYLGDDV